jgi:hypothetical protein
MRYLGVKDWEYAKVSLLPVFYITEFIVFIVYYYAEIGFLVYSWAGCYYCAFKLRFPIGISFRIVYWSSAKVLICYKIKGSRRIWSIVIRYF